jgi:Ca-activated chloride channel family protein
MPAEFHFLRPDWLWALPAVLLAVTLLARRQLGPGSWHNVVDAPLAPHVLSSSASRNADFRWWLAGLGGVIAVLALAGPAWQRIEQPVFRSDQALVVALDLSRSMDAQDVAPSRLTRARLKILDLLERREGGQTALVVYSSNAFTVTPLTKDAETIAALVNSLGTDIMPSRGSYPPAAIDKGRDLLKQAGASVGEILLITDGGSSPAAERTARELREDGYTLSVLAVGTPEGAPIPRISGGFVTDRSGRIAVPRLEESGLRDLASAGGGRYARLSTGDRDLDGLLSGEVGKSVAGDESLATDRWREEGPWLLLLLLPIAATAFRRGWLLLVAIAILPVPRPAEAAAWDSLWFNRDQQAERRLEDGDAAAAAEIFDDPAWRAVAEYRARDFERSERSFADLDDPENLYNLGNALARQGEFDQAIAAYDEVLEVDPDHEDAAYNRDLLVQAKKQQEQQEQQQQDQSDSQDGASRDGQGEQSDDDSEAQQQPSDESGRSEKEPGDEMSQRPDDTRQEDLDALQQELQRAAEEAQDEEPPAEQQMTEEELAALRREQEERQAMEQWLRRIPNDPGGLLRRKFRYQYQKSGKDQDGNDTWPDNEVQPW